jgi:hypothetical protein
MKSEDSVPKYFKQGDMIEQINFIEGMKVPSMLVVKFQAIILKDILLRNDISSVEI